MDFKDAIYNEAGTLLALAEIGDAITIKPDDTEGGGWLVVKDGFVVFAGTTRDISSFIFGYWNATRILK